MSCLLTEKERADRAVLEQRRRADVRYALSQGVFMLLRGRRVFEIALI